MNNLKLCPFCGGVAKLNAPGYAYYSPYWCKCTQCGAEGPIKSSKLEAETGWNKRIQDNARKVGEVRMKMAALIISIIAFIFSIFVAIINSRR